MWEGGQGRPRWRGVRERAPDTSGGRGGAGPGRIDGRDRPRDIYSAKRSSLFLQQHGSGEETPSAEKARSRLRSGQWWEDDRGVSLNGGGRLAPHGPGAE